MLLKNCLFIHVVSNYESIKTHQRNLLDQVANTYFDLWPQTVGVVAETDGSRYFHLYTILPVDFKKQNYDRSIAEIGVACYVARSSSSSCNKTIIRLFLLSKNQDRTTAIDCAQLSKCLSNVVFLFWLLAAWLGLAHVLLIVWCSSCTAYLFCLLCSLHVHSNSLWLWYLHAPLFG